MDFKNIHIGSQVRQVVTERGIGISRICISLDFCKICVKQKTSDRKYKVSKTTLYNKDIQIQSLEVKDLNNFRDAISDILKSIQDKNQKLKELENLKI